MTMYKKLMKLFLMGIVLVFLPPVYSADRTSALDASRVATQMLREAIEKASQFVCFADDDAGVKADITSLYDASQSGDIFSVRNILAAGVDPNEDYFDKWTPLLIACSAKRNDHYYRCNYPEVVTALIVAGARVNDANIRGLTPLMQACKCGHKDLVSLLLNAGADVSKKDSDGVTALMYAAGGNYDDIISEIYNYGGPAAVSEWHTLFVEPGVGRREDATSGGVGVWACPSCSKVNANRIAICEGQCASRVASSGRRVSFSQECNRQTSSKGHIDLSPCGWGSASDGGSPQAGSACYASDRGWNGPCMLAQHEVKQREDEEELRAVIGEYVKKWGREASFALTTLIDDLFIKATKDFSESDADKLVAPYLALKDDEKDLVKAIYIRIWLKGYPTYYYLCEGNITESWFDLR